MINWLLKNVKYNFSFLICKKCDKLIIKFYKLILNWS